MQNIFILFFFIIFLIAVLGMGDLIKVWLKLNSKNKVENMVFSLAFGSIFYSYVFHLLGAIQVLYAPILLATYFLPVLWFLYRWIWVEQTLTHFKIPSWFNRKNLLQPQIWIPLVVLAFILVPLLPYLFLYPASWDVVAYHLPLPKFYLAQHSLPFAAWFAQTGFPIGIEALFGFGEALRDARIANFIHFTYIIATVAYLMSGLKYLFPQRTRWLATFLYLFQPMLYTETAVSAFVDYPFAFFSLVTSVLLFKFYRDKKPMTFVGVCILVGFLTLIKSSGLIMAVSFGILFAMLICGQFIQRRKKSYFKDFQPFHWLLC